MSNGKQKLELIWIGKNEQPKLEPRILIEDPEKSYGQLSPLTKGGTQGGFENMLIYGDNLLALKALEQDFTGKIKCIAIDPPYNTGSAFEHYDDSLEHSIWLNLMKPRIEILRNLLSDNGSIWIYIDDNEVHYLKVLCDEIFGRVNFITTICVKMSHLSGMKMSHLDKKPPKLKEFILVFAKDKDKFTLKPAFEKVSWDKALERYTQFITNTEESIENWNVIPIRQAATQAGINYKDKEAYESFLIDNAHRIFRTARNRSLGQTGIRNKFTEIISKRGLKKLIYNDEEVLFASEKMTDVDGELMPVNPVGDIWLDIGINNLHNEGGVDFRNGKKPEKAIHRLIEMSTEENDFVLDSFLGSGTTAAVAHKMKRKWIGIELGEHCHTHCIPRLQKVCDGTDQGGISKSVGWKGGGGFKYYYLAPSLLKQDKYGNWIIEEKYNADMLAAAMAKHNNFKYQPSEEVYWKQGKSSEKDFIYTTTQFITVEKLDQIHEEMQPDESLLICCKKYSKPCENRYSNITIKKIPQMLLGKCEFGREDYSLNIISMPRNENEPEFIPKGPDNLPAGKAGKKKIKNESSPDLFEENNGEEE